MKRNLLGLWIVLNILAGCTDSTAQMTLQANHAAVGTQVADLRVTATVQAARARTTLDFVETRAAAAATQSQFLEATLIATGFAPQSLAELRASMLESHPTALPTLTPAATASPIGGDDQPSPTALPLLGSPTPTLPIVTPFELLVTPLPVQLEATPTDPNAPHLENPVTATGVGSDDCATTISGIFSASSSQIYVVAEAVNVAEGSVIEARWFRGSDPVGPVYTFEPDFDIERACVWFFVEPSDFEFIPGQYAVDMVLNGATATPLITFTITAP